MNSSGNDSCLMGFPFTASGNSVSAIDAEFEVTARTEGNHQGTT